MDFLKSFFGLKSNQILIGLILGDILFIVWLISCRETINENITADGYKMLLQLALITIGGGLISLAFAKLKTEQESREATRVYLRSVFSRAIAEYNKAKKCRRLLRANAIYKEKDGDEKYLRIDEYSKIMTELEDCQLEFESLEKEMIQAKDDKKITSTTRDHLASLESIFHKMQIYLDNILSEFERNSVYKNTNVKLSDKEFEAVKEFAKPKDTAKEKAVLDFHKNFSNPFDTVLITLIEEISK